jgi:hypothetical protein
MKLVCRLLVVVVLILVFGTTVARSVSAGEIALSKVPEKVLAAAQKAVPGIRLTEAEVEKTHKGLVYELEGTADGKEYEIEVSAKGKVLKVEEEDDHDDDHHGHDHHDNDDHDNDDHDND